MVLVLQNQGYGAVKNGWEHASLSSAPNDSHLKYCRPTGCSELYFILEKSTAPLSSFWLGSTPLWPEKHCLPALGWHVLLPTAPVHLQSPGIPRLPVPKATCPVKTASRMTGGFRLGQPSPTQRQSMPLWARNDTAVCSA
jgi:hypothetical protein